MRHLPVIFMLAGCAESDDGFSGENDPADFDASDDRPAPAPLAELSSGQCPDLSQPGRSSFESNGNDRTVYTYFPGDRPADIPVVFMWHPLGASAQMLVDYLAVDELADKLGAVFVVPEAMSDNIVEWGFLTDGEDDLTLFDDVRTCLSNELQVDLRRVTTTGMSAGGLWSSFLLMARSDTLATALVMSGGSEPVIDYQSPVNGDLPVMLMYGGDTDTWGSGGFQVDFKQTTLNFDAELVADGHFVVLCDHGRGHSFPVGATEIAEDWLLAHEYGSPSPFFDDISALPEYCLVSSGQ